jgi:nitroimidazol reductase NimA-like FMN-containing flavoprotein (pyridoxamine 5'-phosphate oxidase superfamily)
VGRIGFVVDVWPVVVPINYAFDGDDLVRRTDARSKLAAETRWTTPVVLEVDEPLACPSRGGACSLTAWPTR